MIEREAIIFSELIDRRRRAGADANYDCCSTSFENNADIYNASAAKP